MEKFLQEAKEDSKALEKIVGEKVKILDSGEAIARQTKVILEQEKLINNTNNTIYQKFYVNTDPIVLQTILDTYNKNLNAIKLDF